MPKLNDLHDLVSNVEVVRRQKYPDIPMELIEKIIMAEYEQLDSRSHGIRSVTEIVSSYLANNEALR